MKHQVFGRKLNRDVKERQALFRSLIWALIVYGKIKTTLAKAKAIQRIVDKLVTKSKEGTDNAIRQVSSFLTKKEAIDKLIRNIAPRFAKTPGGYLRVRRTGKRFGDATEEVVVEWSIKEEKKPEAKPVKLEEKKEKKQPKEKKPVKKAEKRIKASAKGRSSAGRKK